MEVVSFKDTDSVKQHSVLSERSLEWYKISIILFLVGSPFGIDIIPGTRFSGANLFQVISTVILFICFWRFIRLRQILIFSSYVGAVVVSWIMLRVQYNIRGSLVHDFYFATCLACLLLVWVAPKNERFRAISTEALRIGVPLALVVMYSFTVRDMCFRHFAYSSMGFDDKSHAAIYISALAFLILEMSSSLLKIPIAFLVFLSSFLTVSRLSALMAPFFFIALCVSVWRYRQSIIAIKQRKKFDIFFCVIFFLLLVVSCFVIHDLPVFSRFSAGQNTSASNSTLAHIELIKLALQMKFLRVWIVIFGTSPGMFSYLLPISGLDDTRLALLDPGSQDTMAAGALPVHSVPASVLLEFPIWLSLLFFALVIYIVVKLIRSNDVCLWTMYLAVTAATFWYSGHNEPYFLTLLLIVMSFTRQQKNQECEPFGVFGRVFLK